MGIVFPELVGDSASRSAWVSWEIPCELGTKAGTPLPNNTDLWGHRPERFSWYQ